MAPISLRKNWLSQSDHNVLKSHCVPSVTSPSPTLPFAHLAPVMPVPLLFLKLAWSVPCALAVLECSSTKNGPAPFHPPQAVVQTSLCHEASFTTYGRLNTGSKDIQAPIFGICECFLIWQRDLTDAIKIRILTWGNDPGLIRCALNVISSVLMRGRQKEIWRRKCRWSDWSTMLRCWLWR